MVEQEVESAIFIISFFSFFFSAGNCRRKRPLLNLGSLYRIVDTHTLFSLELDTLTSVWTEKRLFTVCPSSILQEGGGEN